MTKYHYFLITLFTATWVWAAIHPTTPQNWLQENLMVFLWVPVIIIVGRYLKLSNFSYTLITLFLMLHLVGAHYNYGAVPFGDMLGHWTHTDRNQYDRLLHFLFGLLLIYPIREFFVRISKMSGFWSYFFPINIILSFSAAFEIFEWLSQANLPSSIGYLFVGGNDPWDSIKDMALAGAGAILTTLLLASVYAIRNGKFSVKNLS